MKYARSAALFLALSSCAHVALSQSPAIKAAKSGVIAGRVTAHGKGLPDVTVTLLSTGFGGQGQDLPQARTDADGNYRITDVPMGNYIVTPVAPVYVVPGAGRATFARDPVVITGGDTVEGIDFSLVPGGVVTGKVLDAAGNPIIEQTVTLQSADQTNGRGGFGGFGGGSARTDDRGVYRIYGVTAGRYYVSVGAQQRLTAYSTVMGQQAYKQTFYPEATDTSNATVVEVTEGGETKGIDITVGNTVDEYAVTGQVVDKTSNVPVPNVGLTLSVLAGGGNRQRAMGLMTLPVFTDAAGQFRIDNMPAGSYMVSLSPDTSGGMSGQSPAFQVINQDVTGVVVQAVSGASVSGSVALDGNNQDPTIQSELMQFQVQVFVQGSDNAGNAASVQTVPLNPDGSFQFGGLPAGTARLMLMAQDPSLQGAFKLLRTEVNGVQQQRGIPLNLGDQLSGVRLVAAYADGIVEGTVSYQNGTPPPGLRVFARVTPNGQTQGRGANLGGANVDSRGHFIIENVPAGSYNLVVTAFAAPVGRGRPRQQPQQPVSTQQQVMVNEGQVSNVTAVLDLSQLQAQPTPTQTPSPTPATPPPTTPPTP
jgi:hypothetical protein